MTEHPSPSEVDFDHRRFLDRFDSDEDFAHRRGRPRLEDFGLKESDLYDISMELARLTDANRPFMPHSADPPSNSLVIAALAAIGIPAYLAAGVLAVLGTMAIATLIGGFSLWILDGGYRRFAARRHPRPDLADKVRAYVDFEGRLYDWRRDTSKSYQLSPSRQIDTWVRCWWNRPAGRLPYPAAYGFTKRPPLNENWRPWDCLDKNEQNIVRFLYWRTRSSRIENAFMLVLTVALCAALFAVLGFRVPPSD
jgi:hypothetical protein